MKALILFLVVAGAWVTTGFSQDSPGNQQADGCAYVGNAADGKYNGQGTLSCQDGRKYVGDFKDGLYDGQGKLTYIDGSTYEGGFKDGALSGEGTITYADGTQYKGRFEDGDIDTAPVDNSDQ